MKTNIVITLDTRRQKKDGTYPLTMRLGHNERTTSILLGVSVKEKDWDAKNRQIKKSYSGVDSVTRLNNFIQKKKAEAMDIIVKLSEEGKLNSMSVSDIKDRIVNKNSSKSFFKFADQVIDELERSNRVGTARSYRDVVNFLKRYRKGKDLLFQQVNYEFLTKFEAQHIGRGNSINGLASYMRTIRAIFNKAIKSGIVEKELYPFDSYKVRMIPTKKRALEWEKLKKIIELDIAPGHECFHARNYFIASFLMYGMNFADMAYLRKENIIDGRIKYRRKKTSKLYDIKITENLEEILSHYINRDTDSNYIFPILKRDTPLLQDRDIKWARKRYNKKLKTLVKMCGISETLTSYVSRHSFATQAMLQEVPINAISSMLGHSSLKTTEIYLKSLPTNILDEYNAKIMQL